MAKESSVETGAALRTSERRTLKCDENKSNRARPQITKNAVVASHTAGPVSENTWRLRRSNSDLTSERVPLRLDLAGQSTLRGVLDDAVLHTVHGIASLEDRVVDHRILARGNHRRRRAVDVGVQPHPRGIEPHLVPRRIARDDAVEIVGIAL